MNEDSLAAVEFIENPEPRCAVVLLLDTSYSMNGDRIQQLNDGLRTFEEAIKQDRLASLRVEVALITFGGEVRTLDMREGGTRDLSDQEAAQNGFVAAGEFQAPLLVAQGNTPMGAAMSRALRLLRLRKEIYKDNSVEYYRPWILLLTDGAPTDPWDWAAREARDEEQRKGVVIYPIGVGSDADMTTLSQFSSTYPPLLLRGLAFRELFQWLSASLSAVSGSSPTGGQVKLPPPNPWAVVDTSH